MKITANFEETIFYNLSIVISGDYYIEQYVKPDGSHVLFQNNNWIN